jgi:hypothetical protein
VGGQVGDGADIQVASDAVVTTARKIKSGPTDRGVMVSPSGATNAGVIMTDAFPALVLRAPETF